MPDSEQKTASHGHDPVAAEREALLRAEIAKLKDRAARAADATDHDVRPGRRPSSKALLGIAIVAAILLGVGFTTGYLPKIRRTESINAETKADTEARPTVSTSLAKRGETAVDLELPGSIQAVTEAPILARADGYLKRRLVDIGDRVAAGQLLAEIEAPELDNQVQQAKASLQQSYAALEQATASLEQSRANEQLARITAQRWSNLLGKGAVSRQDNDNYQAQFQAQSAFARAQERAVAAARSNIEAAKANLDRLNQVQGYRLVRAPFAGMITLRNVDVGALISTGQTLIYRVAQMATLRTFVNVPQAYADVIKPGVEAEVAVVDLPGRIFRGKVARSSGALDASSRTLLTEVQIPNQDGALLPGMYAQVSLSIRRVNPPLIIPGDTLLIRPQGTMVAIVRPDNSIHFQKILVGRDFGKEVEVIKGLEEGQALVVNANDSVQEGVKVKTVKLKEDGAKR
ncbi:efflux RND transporter periplasmic adaptor subunit [Paludibaculum fermentans]|uniref:efflux RND transporter periplasmic adaptor subunit n=1 Tax=Paludibaculum fermentans TaxID=1473598 RepID=UPI003EBDE7D9